eukprot:Skav231175  [mRNA]  locus=scaffold3252:369456:370088:- [translate_table: standard]
MFKHGGPVLWHTLIGLFNKILAIGTIEANWRITFFMMIPKTGDLSAPNNWRPIAILQITYHISMKLLHNRLKERFENNQSHDQFGFRPGLGVEHALIIFESMTQKSIEFGCGLWMGSLDLRKAFDRIHSASVFAALGRQNFPPECIELLRVLYESQFGFVEGSEPFPINRGVKQGDVFSPALFNATLDDVMVSWKRRIAGHGVDVCCQST